MDVEELFDEVLDAARDNEVRRYEVVVTNQHGDTTHTIVSFDIDHENRRFVLERSTEEVE